MITEIDKILRNNLPSIDFEYILRFVQKEQKMRRNTEAAVTFWSVTNQVSKL